MIYTSRIFGWIFALFFGLLTVSMIMLHNWLQALILFLVVLLCMPPVTFFIRRRFNFSIHFLLRFFLVVGLLFVFMKLLIGTEIISIYNSPEVKAQFYKIYDEKMKDWPVPYKDVFVDTRYGKVHVIVSGPEEAQPLLLLHASGVASWSWKFNIAELSKLYRTYAIDLIGDAGKSEFSSMNNVLKTGQDQSELYAEITDSLGVEKAFVAGASEGGFIASNFALYHPERVKRLVLLGPMGYAGATQSVIRIIIAQLFPLKSIQNSTFSWAFSDNVTLKEEFGEWFPLLMNGTRPAKVMPLPFSAEERKKIQVPVLFVFGERDNLVGDPYAARDMVQDIPKVKVEIVDTGHLIAAEKPDQANALMLGFFAESEQ